MNEKTSCVYCFENLVNNKKYVGQALNFQRRLSEHFYLLNKNKDVKLLQFAYNKYGLDNFNIYIVEECSVDILDERERFWIKKLKSHCSKWGYNVSLGGDAPMRGKHHSKESKDKMSVSHIGKTHSEKTKRKMSEIRIGKRHSEVTIEKMSGENHWNFGRHFSEETLEKISGENNHMWGKHHSEETKQKISNAVSGNKHPMWKKYYSKEDIKKISGENSPNSKLKTKDVLEIRKRIKNGEKLSSISKNYGVSDGAISMIKTNRTWKYI